jgi:hypothetical protein
MVITRSVDVFVRSFGAGSEIVVVDLAEQLVPIDFECCEAMLVVRVVIATIATQAAFTGWERRARRHR